ncbi:6856_t:CDS:2 [Diversispora eburnea]|uniref:Large ribosomal subunit protein uL4m n=1 Tax=Diversispora eburnea TaxID=1213867 RepID=A0A9N8V9V1_9GLOM|nr:6856_t:CDS:2 [Diversispora eburnea]
MWGKECSNLFLRNLRGNRYLYNAANSTIKPNYNNYNNYNDEQIIRLKEAFYYDFKTNTPLGIKELDRQVFGTAIRTDIMQRVVVWQRDALRQGTHKTKNRAEVSGTGRKYAPQKGRGRARVGSHRAPHWRGGGVAHGPRPRSHATEIPRQVQLLGLRSALSTKYSQNQLLLVENFNLETPKTKHLLEILDRNSWDPLAKERVQGHSILFLGKEHMKNLDFACRNLQRVHALTSEEIYEGGDVYNIMGHEILMMDLEAIEFV